MSEGRPPKEGAADSELEFEENELSDRASETRSVPGRAPGNAAPRATFSPASDAPKPGVNAGRQSPPPRSVFQQTPSMPTSSDPDKTVKAPYPTAPSTWGQTLPMSDLLPGQESKLFAPEPEDGSERTVQVVRSAFVKTLLGTDGLTPPTPPAKVPSGQSAQSSQRPPVQRPAASAPPEPLTVPSNRPAPTPWQKSKGAPPAATGSTMLMPGATGQHDGAHAHPPAAPAASPRPAHVSAKHTLPLGHAALTQEAIAAMQRKPAQPQPPTQPLGATEAAPAPAAPAARAAGAQPPGNKPAPPARSPRVEEEAARPASVEGKNVSEPLQLRIAERDVVQQARMSEESVLPRSRGPLATLLVIAALIAVAVIAWFWLAKEPVVVPEPTRNDAVTVPAGQPTAAPAAQPPVQALPTGEQPAAAAPVAPAQPAAVPAQPAGAPQAAPTAARPSEPEPREPATAAPAEPKSQSQSSAARRKAEKRAAARRQSARSDAPSGPVPEDVKEARDALQALEDEPVIKIKPTPSDEEAGEAEPDFPPLELPEPPAPE